jgi:hypothetical protein
MDAKGHLDCRAHLIPSIFCMRINKKRSLGVPWSWLLINFQRKDCYSFKLLAGQGLVGACIR